MPHYLIICHDKQNYLELRTSTRPAHLDYVKTFGAAVKVAGPMLDEDQKPKGSCFIIELDDLAAAQNFVASDPYQMAGLFARHSIEVFNPVIGVWAG